MNIQSVSRTSDQLRTSDSEYGRPDRDGDTPYMSQTQSETSTDVYENMNSSEHIMRTYFTPDGLGNTPRRFHFRFGAEYPRVRLLCTSFAGGQLHEQPATIYVFSGSLANVPSRVPC